jgi:hypothetical protein
MNGCIFSSVALEKTLDGEKPPVAELCHLLIKPKTKGQRT